MSARVLTAILDPNLHLAPPKRRDTEGSKRQKQCEVPYARADNRLASPCPIHGQLAPIILQDST